MFKKKIFLIFFSLSLKIGPRKIGLWMNDISFKEMGKLRKRTRKIVKYCIRETRKSGQV